MGVQKHDFEFVVFGGGWAASTCTRCGRCIIGNGLAVRVAARLFPQSRWACRS